MQHENKHVAELLAALAMSEHAPDVASLNISSLVAAAVVGPGLPPRPPAELDGYLDATEACVRRYGWSHTSPQDIARELGVNRTTIYRVLGTKDQIFQLFLAREVHRLIDDVTERGATVARESKSGAHAIVEVCASVIEQVRAHPTIAKLLDDEPELVAEFMRTGIVPVVERFADAFGPLLGVAMEAGTIAKRDPHMVAEWSVRVCLSLLFAPPRVDLREFLREGLLPLFEVPVKKRRKA